MAFVFGTRAPSRDRPNAAALCPGAVSRSAYSSGIQVGPRVDRPNVAAALGAVSRSAYIVGTRPISSGLGLLHRDSGPEQRPPERGGPWGSVHVGLHHRDSGPEQTARTRRPSGQCPGRPTHRDSAYFIGTRPTSSGLGPRADRTSTAALGAVSRTSDIIGTRPTSSGLGPQAESADRPSTADLWAFPQRGYVPVQAGVPVHGRRRAARSGPIRNCSHGRRPVGP